MKNKMTANKLIWLNTREDILDSIADAVIGMQEAGMYSDDYILTYLDEYIGRECTVAFTGFGETEGKFARLDMFVDLHEFFGVGI